MRVVACTPDRVSDALNMCYEEWRLSAMTFVPFDNAHTLSTINACMTSHEYFGRLAYNDADECVGIIGGYISAPAWSSRMIAYQIMWFVRPDAKERGKAAKLLMEAFEFWARTNSCIAIMSGVIADIDNYGADVMHRRLGYTRNGTLYLKKLEG